MRKKLTVLSLFDGISCGRVALERAGIPVENYFASEIDKYAMQISKKNYPDIIQLGDVTEWKKWDLPEIDLVIGGSPCQGFSFAGKQLNFDDPRSALFFDFVDILRAVKPKYFMLENVKMKKEYQEIISDLLGVEPVFINSSLVSAQDRKRLYWTNIAKIEQPEDRKIYLKDIIEDGAVDRNKSYCIDANYFKGGNLKQYFEKKRRQLVFDGLVKVGEADIKGMDCIKRVYDPMGKCPTLTTMGGGHREPKIITESRVSIVQRPRGKNNGGEKIEKSPAITSSKWEHNNHLALDGIKWRKLTPLECERLQTLPDNYTECVSNTQRYKAIGNCWTVDIISHIFSFLKYSL